VSSPHALQLFDTEETLIREVAGFLAAGNARGEMLLVVAAPEHWKAFSRELRRITDLDRTIVEGRLTVIDAESALSRFMRQGRPNRALFVRTIGSLVRRMSADARGRLRIYGEMVELLACDGNFEAAAQLEALWNELGARARFTLFCGYSAAHFAGPDGRAALSAICAQHTHTFSDSTDPLAHFLVGRERGRTR
jgi:hypothetical protein